MVIDLNDCEVIQNNNMVCPFRTNVVAGQHLNELGIPEQYQLTTFPECQYASCPFYNSEGKDNTEKCFKACSM